VFSLAAIGIFLYFFYPILLISISIYISLTKETTAESYFFADRNIHWFVLGVSFLAPSIFSTYILGLTSPGTVSVLPLFYGLVSVIVLILLAWFVTPKILQANVNTLPEYFEKRFNRACKFYVSALYILSNIFIRLLFILIAGNVFIRIITGMDPYFSILFFLVVTSIYLIIGGLQAEVYISVLQTFLIAVVLISFILWIINQGEGINFVTNKITAFSNSRTEVNSNYTPTALILGLPIIAFWFWCADQYIIQKVVSAKSVSLVRKATLVSSGLQLIPVLIFVLPGIIISTLFPDLIFQDLLPALFNNGFLPRGLKGGLIIAVAAVLMAAFASLFNSTTVLITSDFYRTFKPNSSDRKLVLVGRLTILVLLFCSVLLVPISQALDFSFCIKLLNTFSYFIALIAAVFIISLIKTKIKAASALLTLCASTVIILLRVVHEIFYNNHFFSSAILKWFTHSGFLEFSIFIFMLTIMFLFVFNKVEWIRIVLTSFKRVFLKRKYNSGFHKKVFVVLPALAIAAGILSVNLF